MNYVCQLESGSFHIRGGDIATYVNRADEMVEIETRIPHDAKVAVKDLLRETLQNVSNTAKEIIIDIPEYLSEFTEVILEIIKVIFGG